MHWKETKYIKNTNELAFNNFSHIKVQNNGASIFLAYF